MNYAIINAVLYYSSSKRCLNYRTVGARSSTNNKESNSMNCHWTKRDLAAASWSMTNEIIHKLIATHPKSNDLKNSLTNFYQFIQKEESAPGHQSIYLCVDQLSRIKILFRQISAVGNNYAHV